MSKIQISTVKQTCDVQVINVNAYLISKIVKAQILCDDFIENNKQEKEQYNEETGEWETVRDEGGNLVYEYRNKFCPTVEDYIYPILKELVDAFEE